MNKKPRVTAESVVESFGDSRMCDPYTRRTPGVSVSVDFDLHDHKAALDALESAVQDVRNQIADSSS
jgi:hypothetical protein